MPPTEEGRRRYPPEGLYTAGFDDTERDQFWIPCTCQPSCPPACKGECGCKACHAAYGDFLSAE